MKESTMSLTQAQETQVRNKMKTRVKECVDPRTAEVNSTLLAEMVANDLNLYEDDDFTIPERIFDIAVEFNDLKD